MSIPQKAIDLILTAECIDQPAQWPGGESGITIGYGYDLGYEKNFARDWEGYLPTGHIERLKVALGKTGATARALRLRFKDIVITSRAAREVFLTKTLPHYEEETQQAFRGVEKLPPLAYGALVSVVFNRGSGMVGARRLEMRAIRNMVALHANGGLTTNKCLQSIAVQLRMMKRLWEGKGLNGLLVRREHEAKLVEEAMG